MKTKLLSVVAACALALTVGTANATTYVIDGGDLVLTAATCDSGSIQPNCDLQAAKWLANPLHLGPLTGTIGIDNGTLATSDLVVGGVRMFIIPGVPTILSDLSFTSQDQWTLFMTDGGPGDRITLVDDNQSLAAAYVYSDVNPMYPVQTFSAGGTITVTPLPTALPLFATGLVGLGLLGWRRKRKDIAA